MRFRLLMLCMAGGFLLASVGGCLPLYPVTTLAVSLDALQAHKHVSQTSNMVWASDGNAIFLVQCWYPFTTKVRKARGWPDSIIPEWWFAPFGTETAADPSRPRLYRIMEIDLTAGRRKPAAGARTIQKWTSSEDQWTKTFKHHGWELGMAYDRGHLRAYVQVADRRQDLPETSNFGLRGRMRGAEEYLLEDDEGNVQYAIDVRRIGAPGGFFFSPDKSRIVLFTGKNMFVVRTADVIKGSEIFANTLDSFVKNLSAATWWQDGPSFPVDLPAEASLEDVLAGLFAQHSFKLSPQMPPEMAERVKNYKVLAARDLLDKDAFSGGYKVIYLNTNLGEKFVLLKYVGEKIGWSCLVFSINLGI